jgi:hypothetical protein
MRLPLAGFCQICVFTLHIGLYLLQHGQIFPVFVQHHNRVIAAVFEPRDQILSNQTGAAGQYNFAVKPCVCHTCSSSMSVAQTGD